MQRSLGIGVLAGAAWVALAAASAFTGTYGDGQVTMEINETAPGEFGGVILVGDEVFAFTARESGGALAGKVTMEDETGEFRATLKGSTLTLTMEGESHTLTRRGTPAPSATSTASPAPAQPSRPLRVNRVAIPDAQVQAFERENRVVIPRGDFWYDTVSGAWGVDGGPTLGFTAPGMRLGGPLPADASHGDTGVFINGRELPLQDVIGLQQMSVPVQRGRWWVDSQGNFGVEGVPVATGNLFQFSRGKGGAYQRATAGGYIGGDGQTSYFFDPSTGASVMTGN